MATTDQRKLLRAAMVQLVNQKSKRWDRSAMEWLGRSLLGEAGYPDGNTTERPAEITLADATKASEWHPGPEAPGIVKYLRRLGFGSLLLGVARLIPNPSLYWWQTSLIYLAASFFLIDIWFEHWKGRIKLLGASIVLGLVLLFTFGTVLVSAPLSFVALSSSAVHPTGAVLAGIRWNPKFTALTILIFNDSPTRDYDNLDILIQPDQPVAQIGQVSNVPGVYFEDNTNRLQPELVDPSSGKREALPTTLLASTKGYRVLCPRLPSHSRLELLLAIAKPTGKDAFAIDLSNGSKFWRHDDTRGSLMDDGLFSDPVSAKTILVVGQYTDNVAQHRRSVSNHLVVTDMLGDYLTPKGK